MLRFQNKKWFKVIAVTLALFMLENSLFPVAAFALTSGPSQPEFTSFEPIETTQMVDPYSGDFTYNIPLLSVPGPNGGYPINMAYHSNVGMEQEASWVGLGWSLNVGAINRQLRGIPDDFSGDKISYESYIKPTYSFGLDIPATKSREFFGFPVPIPGEVADFRYQIYYNSNKGVGYRAMFTPAKINSSNSPVGLGLSYDSQGGFGIEPRLNVSSIFSNKEDFGLVTEKSNSGMSIGASLGISSREGLTRANFDFNLQANQAAFRILSDKEYYNRTQSTGSFLSFNTLSAISVPQIPITGRSGTFDIKFPTENFSFVPYSTTTKRFLNYSGYYSETQVKYEHTPYSKNAYGYLYTGLAGSDAQIDHAYSDNNYSKSIPYLNPSSFNYDLYSISAQGVGGHFRPYRSEVGILSNGRVESIIEIDNKNYEFGAGGNTVHIGLDPMLNDGSEYMTSGAWTSGNSLSMLNFSAQSTSDKEPFYFQLFGEKTATELNENFLSTWGGDQAVRLKLNRTSDWATREFESGLEFINIENGSTLVDVASSIVLRAKTKRVKRAAHIQQLTNNQAALYGYSSNTMIHDITSNSYISKFASTNTSNSLSELSVLQSDGTRYIYGIPAMNNAQEECSFRVNYNPLASISPQSPTSEHLSQLLKTSSCLNQAGTDFIGANGGNNLPLDEFFHRTKVPAYAHSWMLTTIVSADYIDLTGNGPTDDDYGYWVKFNYKKQYPDYKWRVPYSDISYNPGHIGDPSDNSGMYMYGTKEIFYVESVETKTHIAEFITSSRKDAVEAYGVLASAENLATSKGTRSMHRLDEIKLFTKAEKILNPSNPVPLQVVHFEYDYSLCPNVPNNNQQPEYDAVNNNLNAAHGKLTLRKVWFSYQSNNRGRLSPYVFEYNSFNPSYSLHAVDKWGEYRQPLPGSEGSNYPVIRFPYSVQDYVPSAAWLLNKVTMPSGGKINVEYESDDYAYVQDKPALQMFDIVGTSTVNSVNGRASQSIYRADIDPSNSHIYGDDGNFRIHFKLEHIPTTAELAQYSGTIQQKAKAYVLDKYIRGIKKVYFNIEAELVSPGQYDEVGGYADIVTDEDQQVQRDYYGIVQNTNGSLTSSGYITLKKEPISEANIFNDFIHPFQKAGFNHIRANRSELIFPNQNTNNWSTASGFSTVNVSSLFGFIPDAYKAITGINRYLASRNFCEKININGRSVIRLSAPDAKMGGGFRVKKLSIDDSDFEFSGDNSTYGQQFDYTMEENGEIISSGVAYEPLIGGDESALRYPVDYKESVPLKSTLNLFAEQPILESYYPGSSVGYRKVTVRSLVREQATGADNSPDACHSVSPVISYEFYTPKDFPVIADETDISPSPGIVRAFLIPGVMTKYRKSLARSQGYSVVLNDMAGKIRKVTTLVPADPNVTGSADRIISQEEYIYQTKTPYSPGQTNELDCKVQVMNKRGVCSDALIGETSEIFTSMNENKSASESETLNWNIALNSSIMPFIIPVPLPTIVKSEMSLKTAVTMKVIYRTGILKQVRKFDGQATVVTDNLVYDAETGAPLVTRVNNEFDDHIFGFSVPAHWFYSGMEGAYQNQGFSLSGLNSTVQSGGQLVFSTSLVNVTQVFEPGDELWITPTSGSPFKAYILELVTSSSQNGIRLIDTDGDYVTGTLKSLYIIRSGKRNLQSAEAGSLTMNIDPRLQSLCQGIPLGNQGDQTLSLKGVLNANAVQYSQYWNKGCGTGCGVGSQPGDKLNPFLTGMQGVWRPYKTYAYLEEREQADNIREDGTYKTFNMFNWDVPSLSVAKWTLAGTITKYSPQGYEIENKDPLGVYSSALYGYGNSLVTAVSANSRYTEMLFDGFEDYPKSCVDAHWALTTPSISSTVAHTGKRSLQVNPSSDYTVGLNTAATQSADLSGTPGFSASLSSSFVSLLSGGCNGVFTPVSGKDYFLSAWVHENVSGQTYAPVTHNNSQIVVQFYTDATRTTSVGTSLNFTPSAAEQIIEGWQRISGKFTVPSGAGYMEVKLRSTSASATVSFDDLRILPAKANMRAFVYDPITLRHTADLDDNNFATWYVYDREGNLIMKRVETSEGIRTIQESRIGSKH
ncbi:MAG: hypothetical protein ACK5Z2_01055 [Bacteroidota bacterium]